MTVKIKKLTPPQIAEVRAAYPACIKAGIITTTGSIVTFHDVNAERRFNKTDVRLTILKRLERIEAHQSRVKMWSTILDKLESRPDLVEES